MRRAIIHSDDRFEAGCVRRSQHFFKSSAYGEPDAPSTRYSGPKRHEGEANERIVGAN